MGMLTSPFWLKLLWVLHLRLWMSTGAAQPPQDEQEPARDLEEVANLLHTQHSALNHQQHGARGA